MSGMHCMCLTCQQMLVRDFLCSRVNATSWACDFSMARGLFVAAGCQARLFTMAELKMPEELQNGRMTLESERDFRGRVQLLLHPRFAPSDLEAQSWNFCAYMRMFNPSASTFMESHRDHAFATVKFL